MLDVYILASGRNGTLNTGHTDDLIERVRQDREKERCGFSAHHRVDQLVWYEEHPNREGALTRDRQIKTLHRAWKLRTIEAANPEWRDLYDDLLTPEQPLHADLHAWAADEQASLDPRTRGETRD